MADNRLLMLIDAYSQIFRNFYAIRILTDSRGNPVNAIYGFCKLLQKLEREYPSSYGAMVFDCGRVKFRLQLNPEYKANRKPTPEELKAQIPIIRELSEAFGWALLEEPEYEADDLIAALAQSYDGEVRIVSSDKDLSQLVSDRIIQLVPDAKSGLAPRRIQEVQEKFCVPPERVVDFLAILGDSADNIPGATGIGEKGAVKLLSFGSLRKLLEHPELVTDEKLRAKLISSNDRLQKNIELITLRRDLPARIGALENICRRRTPDYGRIREICERCELHSIIKSLPDSSASASASAAASAPPSAPETMVQDDLFGDL